MSQSQTKCTPPQSCQDYKNPAVPTCMFLANGEFACDSRIANNYNNGEQLCKTPEKGMDVPMYRPSYWKPM